MNKIILTIFLTGFFYSMIQAQHFNLGIKGGLNVYTINTPNVDNGSLASFNLGLLGHIHLDKQFAVQPEFVYSGQGTTAPSGAKLNLGYVNVPVLFQYMFDNGFRLQVGPQVGFLVSANSTLNGSKTDIMKDLKSIDISLSPGIGYVHPPSGIGFDLRYNFGLSNINKTDAVISKNNGLQFGLFYLFKHN